MTVETSVTLETRFLNAWVVSKWQFLNGALIPCRSPVSPFPAGFELSYVRKAPETGMCP
jgi:hypothetical protein